MTLKVETLKLAVILHGNVLFRILFKVTLEKVVERYVEINNSREEYFIVPWFKQLIHI